MEPAGYPDAVERAGAFKDMHPEVVIEYQDGRHAARRDGEVLATSVELGGLLAKLGRLLASPARSG